MVDWRIIGNERAVEALSRALAGDSSQHAYLFVGPEGVGRATAARRLAQALNCTSEERPCLECGQCRRIEAAIHPDVITVAVEAAEETPSRKVITADQVRELAQRVSLSPYEGRTRVVVIDPAEAMSQQAQNTFLKTLEEPPPQVVFVLITGDENQLLETIRSRCARVEFGAVASADIEQALLERGVEGGKAAVLAKLARGRPGWALAAAQTPAVLEKRQDALAQARALSQMPVADRIDLAERLSERFRADRESVRWLLEQWQLWWRDVLLVQAGAEEAAANADMAAELREDAARYERADVTRFVQALMDTRGYLGENIQSRIALDSLVLQAPGLSRAAR